MQLTNVRGLGWLRPANRQRSALRACKVPLAPGPCSCAGKEHTLTPRTLAGRAEPALAAQDQGRGR